MSPGLPCVNRSTAQKSHPESLTHVWLNLRMCGLDCAMVVAPLPYKGKHSPVLILSSEITAAPNFDPHLRSHSPPWLPWPATKPANSSSRRSLPRIPRPCYGQLEARRMGAIDGDIGGAH